MTARATDTTNAITKKVKPMTKSDVKKAKELDKRIYGPKKSNK